MILIRAVASELFTLSIAVRLEIAERRVEPHFYPGSPSTDRLSHIPQP